MTKELHEAFSPHGLLVTAAIGAAPNTLDKAYDVKEIYKYLDFVHVMCYDYHGSWDKTTGHNAPLYANSNAKGDDLILTVAHSWEILEKKGAIPEKTVMGVPFYGRTFKLRNPHDARVGAMIAGAGTKGPYTNEVGFMGYNEICEELKENKDAWKIEWDNDMKAPFMHSNLQWICFDNQKSIAEKVKFAKEKNLGGIMVWSIDTDDFSGKCGEKFPLLTTINDELAKSTLEEDSGSSSTIQQMPSITSFFAATTLAICAIWRF